MAQNQRMLFQILSADANPQFAVDPGIIATSVTRLERLIRDADAFIGIYPFPQDTDVTVERLKSESRYFRLELDLAERASKPAMVFVDRRKRQLPACGPRNAVASRRSENEGGARQIATGWSNHPRRIWRDAISAYVGISGPGPWSIPLFNPSMSDERYRLASARLLTARRAHLYCAARARGVPVRRVCVSLWRLRPLRGRPYRQVSCSQ
jgi:hypothetical protein